MRYGGNHFDYFPAIQLTKFSACFVWKTGWLRQLGPPRLRHCIQ